MGAWLSALVLTAGVELPFVFGCAPAGLRRRAAADSLLVNLLTHPLAWLAVGSGALPWAATEVLVAATEALAYRAVTRMPWNRALLASLCANAVTAALSFVV